MVVRARDCRGRGAACHRDRVSSRTYTLVPTALVRAGPRSSAPAVIRCGFVRKFVSVRVQRGACCARLHIHIPMPIPIPMSIHMHVRDSHASLESQEVDPMRFPRNSHASLESQEVDPMRFPARGTSDQDDPMSLRTRTPTSSRKEGIFVSVSGILNKLKIHEFPRRNHDFACFPLSSAASTLLVREPGLNPRKKHYIQHVSNP